MRLLVPEALVIGDIIEINLKTQKRQRKPVVVIGKIVWVKRVSGGPFEIGVDFVNIKDSVAFTSFICDRIVISSFENVQGV